MAKKGEKADKVTRKITVKIPKKLRKKIEKKGDKLIAKATSPSGRRAIAAGLAMAASAVAARAANPPRPPEPPVPPVPPKPGEAHAHISPEVEKLVDAVGQAANAFVQGFLGRKP